jgi:hypothetical protein
MSRLVKWEDIDAYRVTNAGGMKSEEFSRSDSSVNGIRENGAGVVGDYGGVGSGRGSQQDDGGIGLGGYLDVIGILVENLSRA